MSFSDREFFAWSWPSTEVAASPKTATDESLRGGPGKFPPRLRPPRKPSAMPRPPKAKGQCQATIRVREINQRLADGQKLGDSQRQYREVLRRGDPDNCYLCGCVLNDGNRTLDHVVPKSKGGGDGLANKKLACVTCNIKKGNTSLPEYLARRVA